MCAREQTDDRRTVKVRPERLGRPVVHHKGRSEQLAGRAECRDVAINRPLVGCSRVAQRAVGHRDWHTANSVIDDLVPNHRPDRICPRVAVYDNCNDCLLPWQYRNSLGDVEKGRVFEWEESRPEAGRQR